MSVIDAHQHFWWIARRPHRWPEAVGDRLHRDFTPDDLRPELRAAGIDGTVLIQSLNDLAETGEYLDLSCALDFVRGVVGWIPLADAAAASRSLQGLAGRGKLVGIRHLINFEPDPDWLVQPEVLESLALVADAGLAFDTVPVDERQFASVLSVAARFPRLRMVIDHLGRPPVPEQGWEPWASLIARAAELPNVAIKLSAGLSIVMGWAWSTEALRRYADHVLDRFGPERVMAASNWPVVLLAGSYREVWGGIADLVAGLSAEERQAVLGGTAERVYRLT
jgi:L-fuconolactonase